MNWLEWCGVILLVSIGIMFALILYALSRMAHRAAVQVYRHWIYVFRDWPRAKPVTRWMIFKWALRDWWCELFASYTSQTIAHVVFPYDVRKPVGEEFIG